MYATVAAHLSRATLADAILTGRRYGGADAVAAGIATEAVAEDAVLDRAVELAAEMAAKDRNVIRAHKELLHGDGTTHLRRVAAGRGSGGGVGDVLVA